MALNQSKMVFAKQELKFAGYIVGEEGFRPGPEMKQAIRDFPSPLNATDLKSFLSRDFSGYNIQRTRTISTAAQK